LKAKPFFFFSLLSFSFFSSSSSFLIISDFLQLALQNNIYPIYIFLKIYLSQKKVHFS